MKTQKLLTLLIASSAMVLSCLPARAVVITSDLFVQAYGATLDSFFVAWTQTETGAINTAQTIGDFSFIPNVTGSYGATPGPTFTGGVLGDGASSYSGDTTLFDISVTGSYNGVIPLGATDIKLTLYITDLSIYGARFSFSTATELFFNETTAGNVGSSTPTSLTNLGAFTAPLGNSASSYTQNVWNPADVEVSGTTSTRTFQTNNGSGLLMIDGLYIGGYVELSYTAVPEPSSIALLSLSALGAAVGIRRRRR